MSIEIKPDILAKELNQGIVPLGVPKAYQYDAALVEAARAAVNQGLDDVAEAGATAVTSVKAQESTSTTNINTLGDKIITLGDKIIAQMKHGYGYPFTAATAAAMTDTAKIYVYTGSETGYTNGNWYYHNGTAWVSGGVYNATALETDKTLTVSGAAADSQITGYVRDQYREYQLRNLINTRPLHSGLVWGKYLTSNGTASHDEWLYEKTYINVKGYSKVTATVGVGFIQFYDGDKNIVQTLEIQVFTTTEYDVPPNAVYMRYAMNRRRFTTNTGIFLCSLEQYNEALKQGMIGTTNRYGDYIFTVEDGTLSSPFTSANEITFSSIFYITGFVGTASISNLPNDFVNDGKSWILKTDSVILAGETISYQYFSRALSSGVSYFRQFRSDDNSWTEWKVANDSIKIIETMIWDDISNNTHVHPITDANDAEPNTCYRIQGTNGATSITNLPPSFVNDGGGWLLITSKRNFGSDTMPFLQQTLGRAGKGAKWTRTRGDNNVWNSWRYVGGNEYIIECGVGKEFSTLRSAIAAAIQSHGSHVKVYPGTYDLTQEFATEIANHTAHGIELANDVYVEFMAGSYVTAIFDNTDSWICHNFQPFYSTGNGSFVLDGLNIKAQNTRYCVHDEHVGQGTYHHTYKNCIMHYINTYEPLVYVQCIGGGLGQNGFISIEGGMYTSEPNYARPGRTIESLTLPITYHNGNNANALSKIFIKDVYLTGKGHFRFGDYGPSTNKTPVLITGCRMGAPTLHSFENQEFSVVNFEITEWNNDIAVS